MLTASAYAATAATEPLSPITINRRDPGPQDVLIEIKYCGICHSDIHHARGERGPEPYPLSAHTTLPWAFPLTPLRTDSVFTISRPRPSSPSGSSMTRGPSGAPPS